MDLQPLQTAIETIRRYQNLCSEPRVEVIDLVRMKALLESGVGDARNILAALDFLIVNKTPRIVRIPAIVLEEPIQDAGICGVDGAPLHLPTRKAFSAETRRIRVPKIASVLIGKGQQ